MPARRLALLTLPAAVLLSLVACSSSTTDDAAPASAETSSAPTSSAPATSSVPTDTATSSVTIPTVPEASEDAKEQFVGAVIVAIPQHDPDFDKIVSRGENVCLDIAQTKDDATLLRNIKLRFTDQMGNEANDEQASAVLSSARESICAA